MNLLPILYPILIRLVVFKMSENRATYSMQMLGGKVCLFKLLIPPNWQSKMKIFLVINIIEDF